MVKILFLIDGLVSGGAEKLLNDILPLIREKYYCELAILTDVGERYLDSIRKAGIKVEIISKITTSHIGRIRFLKRYIKQEQFNIVHAHLFPSIYYCSIVKRLLHSSFSAVMTEHNTFNRRRNYKILKPVERWIYRNYDRVVSINEETENEILRWLGEKKTCRYEIAENGVDLMPFFTSKPYKKAKICPGATEDDTIIGFVGRLEPQKNHIFMLDVLYQMPKKYKLVVVGEGSQLERIRERIKALKMEDRVRLLGYRRDIPELMKSFDITVIPSKWEGFGLVAAESMAAGTPVVCSDVEGLSDVVSDAGCVVNLEDLQEFKQAILKLSSVCNEETIKHKCMERARIYDIRNTCSRYIEIYDSLLYTGVL